MPHKLTKQQIKTAVNRGAKTLFDYCQKHNIHFVITGSSGGLDSAVTLGFARQACLLAKKKNFSLTSIGLILPCHSHPQSEKLGRLAIKKFQAIEIKIDLSEIFDGIEKELLPKIDKKIKNVLKKSPVGKNILNEWEWSQKIAQGNVKARLRMMLGTYQTAKMFRGIVLSTDNLSEYWMAFWTICGDVGDFGIIQNILKGLELYDIARYLDVPPEIISAKPDDGLGISGGDEDQLGASYPILDKTMIALIQKGFNINGSLKQLNRLPKIEGVPKKIVRQLANRCLRGAFKRQGVIIISRQELGLPDIEKIKV